MLDSPDSLTGLLCCKQCGCSYFLQVRTERVGVCVVDGAGIVVCPYPLTKRTELICRQCNSHVPPELLKRFRPLEFPAYDPLEN